ncbi:hypothetical protein [Clostridium algifaecis]|uniref:hypothetical protein n=1 Tax=Clostridium algifaecis TaxID=1472040 RepID=UPI001AEB2AEC|nr:hypothetical protein [Clostridium algifaecis]
MLLPGCLIGAFLAPVSGRILNILGAKKPILFGNTCIIVAAFSYSILAILALICSLYVFHYSNHQFNNITPEESIEA